MAYGSAQGNINSVSISDNSISISQSLVDDRQLCSGGVTTASKSSQTPKSTKKKTATATATITKHIPSNCSGEDSGGLITTSATITGEANCSLIDSDTENDEGMVSSIGKKMFGTGKTGNGLVGSTSSVGDNEEAVDEECDEDIDELVNGSGENLFETAVSPRGRKAKQSKPKKLKPASKTKNPRSNNNNSSTTNNNNSNSNKKNDKQLKTDFDDIAADQDSLNEPSGSGTKVAGLRNRWHGCPELHKAMAGVTYIADHTRKEEESTRVS